LEPFRSGRGPLRITETSFKFFPSQIHTQGPIGLALELRSEVKTSDIATIRIRGYRAAVRSAATDPQKWAPQTRETADHSIPYLVATALHDGAVTPASFDDAHLHHPEVRRLMAKMTIEEDPEFTPRFPEELNSWMEITTVSGRRIVAHTAHPKGHQHNPLQDTDLETKFRHLADGVLTEQQSRAALTHLWSLDQATNLHALFESLVI
jgi:2-methylcitrate dehydratase